MPFRSPAADDQATAEDNVIGNSHHQPAHKKPAICDATQIRAYAGGSKYRGGKKDDLSSFAGGKSKAPEYVMQMVRVRVKGRLALGNATDHAAEEIEDRKRKDP